MTGLGFPNDMKPFVKDGTSPVFGLWNVPELGYLAYQVAAKLVSGEIKGTEGETFTVKGLNDDKPYTIGKDSIVILGPPFRFDETNVDTLQLLGSPTGAASEPRRLRLPGLRPIQRRRGWNGSDSRCGCCRPGGRVPAAARGRLAGDARRAQGGRRARLLDLPPRRRPVRLSRGGRLRALPRARWRRRRSTIAGRPRWPR